MKVTDHINRAGKTLFTFEILPPLKGETIDSIHRIIDPLMEFKPAFIDVTYHREEIVYKSRPGGLLERWKVRKRPGTVGISASIKYKYGVDVVPHIICGGFSREETENGLIDLNFLDIHNLLVIRGDNLKSDKYFIPDPNGHAFAIDLVKQIMDMNRGNYLDEELEITTPTHFSVGVAGYPEKHFEAPNLLTDLEYLRQKVEAGADYIVTQMFFDNGKYFDFVKACRDAGIKVPIIPGLKPIATKAQLTTLPTTFHIDIPDDLVKAVMKCRDNAEVRKAGVEWCIEQSRELITFGVPIIHYFTMGKSDNIRQIAREVF
ncbi:MAG TPA: methylenetetrahydrofolate reductase [Bacteroidales bacterium]|nr:methylenetetrahydrofolate reductase [Bacteroidales bacterium]HSA44575.1 methylenetetrahydrofolate reductase [Bacteroidales bacterium]